MRANLWPMREGRRAETWRSSLVGGAQTLSHEAELGRSNGQTINKILCANLLRSSSTPLDDGFDGATADGELEAPGPIIEKYAAYLDGPDAHRAVVTGARLVPPR